MPDNKQKVLTLLHELHQKIDLSNRLISGVVVKDENLLRCGSALQLLDESNELLTQILDDNWWN